RSPRRGSQGGHSDELFALAVAHDRPSSYLSIVVALSFTGVGSRSPNGDIGHGPMVTSLVETCQHANQTGDCGRLANNVDCGRERGTARCDHARESGPTPGRPGTAVPVVCHATAVAGLKGRAYDAEWQRFGGSYGSVRITGVAPDRAASRHIAKIRVHPHNPDLVYVAALGHAWGPNEERGLYRSRDGGRTWEKILSHSERAGAIDLSMDPHNPRILYAAFWEAQRTPYSLSSGGPGSSLYKSTDGGDTWTELTNKQGLPAGVKGKIGVAVSPARADRVGALVEAEDGALF